MKRSENLRYWIVIGYAFRANGDFLSFADRGDIKFPSVVAEYRGSVQGNDPELSRYRE